MGSGDESVFRIKICGITNVEDACAVVAAGADAIGLNFSDASPRHIDLDVAQGIVEAVPSGVHKVGVFVNASVEYVCEASDRLQLDWAQLHGDEPPEYLAKLGHRQIIKALRCSDQGVGPLEEYLKRCFQFGQSPHAVLVDAFVPRKYGGTGRIVDWGLLTDRRPWLVGRPLVLAGGLTPENVHRAIQVVQPTAVDTASGVESGPGQKDISRVQRFVEEARAALAEV